MKNFWFIVVNLIIAVLVMVMSEKSSDTLRYINNLQEKLKLTSNPHINLVVGNSGTGKSTLVHYVAGDYSKIVSIKMGRKYKLVDGLDPEINRTTYSTESRTLVPERVVDEEGYVWYDCPGFGDTHNETVEIATSFLIRKVIENVSNVKIVLVVNYESVTDGYNRNDFDMALSRITQLLKNAKQFENSLSLVVTKVPQYDEFGELLDVADIQHSTVDFIRMHRTFLQTKNVTEKKVQLVDAILKETKDGDYPRISVFWRPSQAGSFDKVSRMVEGRKRIRESIIRQTSYAETQKNDFGFPLTGEARLEVMNITKNSIDSISNILQNIINESLNNTRFRIELAADFEEKLRLIELGQSCTDSTGNVTVTTLKQLTERLKKLIQRFEMQSINADDLNRVEQLETNLRIFESLVEGPQSSSDYHPYLERLIVHFSKWEGTTRERVMNEIQQTTANITSALADVDRRILEFLRRNVQTMDVFQDRLQWLRLGKDSLDSVSDKEFTLQNRRNQFKILIESLNISSIDFDVLKSLDQLDNKLVRLKLLSKTVIPDPLFDWQTNSSNALDYMSSQHNWCSFLQQTYNFFGSYEVQRDVSVYNVANLSNWEQLNQPQGLIIDANNFNEFVRKFTAFVDFKPTESNLQELNEIIDVTLQSQLNFEYDGDDFTTVTVKGIFLKSSDILPLLSDKSIDKFNVFVVDTFHVDCDLNLTSNKEIELNILAHTWNIRQAATFSLNGIDGEPPMEPPQTNGTAGQPGNPGENGGNFFGWANRVIHGELLLVELNGGKGGNGQGGSGNEDFGAEFNMTKFSASHILPKYYETFVEDHLREKGFSKFVQYDNVLVFRFTILLFSGSDRLFKYAIYPDRCCGKTGRGGEGGMGGHPGHYTFIQSSNNSESSPTLRNIDGPQGISGQDAEVCRTYNVHVDVKAERLMVLIFSSIEIAIEKFGESINNKCPAEYVSNNEMRMPKTKSKEHFYAPPILLYRIFLRDKMGSRPLLTTTKESFEAMDSNKVPSSIQVE